MKPTEVQKDSVLLALKELCYKNRKLIKEIIIDKDDHDQLWWELQEHHKMYGGFGGPDDVLTPNPRISIYGINITHY